MTRQVRCECGYTARGETDAAVIALVLAHVAADHPETARRAARKIVVEYEQLPAVTDPRKGYHLELATTHLRVSRELAALLRGCRALIQAGDQAAEQFAYPEKYRWNASPYWYTDAMINQYQPKWQ